MTPANKAKPSKRIAWRLLAISATLATLITLASLIWSIALLSNNYGLAMGEGAISICSADLESLSILKGIQIDRSEKIILWPAKINNPGFRAIIIPLWMPLAVLYLLLFFIHRRSKPPHPGCCHQCGYNLTGNLSGTCPECGTEADQN